MAVKWLLLIAAVSLSRSVVFESATGFPAVPVLAGIMMFAPEIVQRFFLTPFFKPDVTISADPFNPDPAIISEGFKQTMLRLRGIIDRRSMLRILVTPIPGWDCTVAFNTFKTRVFVELTPFEGVSSIDRPPYREGQGVRRSQRTLPSFSLGTEKSVYRISGDLARTECLRLIAKMNTVGIGRIFISEWRWRYAAAADTIAIVGAFVLFGIAAAFVMACVITARRIISNPGLGKKGRLIISFCAAAVIVLKLAALGY